jgi:tol-pal system protein YbgF
MKTMLAFMVGVLVGALFASGGWLMARHGIQPGRPAELLLSGLQAVRVDFAALGLPTVAASYPAVRRPVTGMVRMAASSVVLAQSSAPSPMRVEQRPSLDKPRPAAVDPDSIPLSQPKAASKPAASKVVSPLPPDKQYASALKNYEAGRYPLARKEFAQFVAAHPDHGLVPNALYWTGETWYSQGRLEQAAQAFARVLRDHPRHAKSPDALLKLAYTALRQGQTSQARAYLDQLQMRYPESRASRLGREARSRMQGDNGPALAVAVHG